MERGRKRKLSQDESGSSVQGRSSVPGSRPASLENIQCKKARTDSDSKSSPSRTSGRETRSASTTGSNTSSSSSSNSAIRKNRITTVSSNITPATYNTSTTSKKPDPSNKPTTCDKPSIRYSPATNSKATTTIKTTASNKPSGSNTPSTSNKPSTSSKSTISNSKRELKNLQDAWSSEVSPFRTRSHREEQGTPSKKSRRQIQFPEAETLTSSSSTSSGSGVESSASSYSSINSKTGSSSFLSSNSGSYTSGETGSSTTGYTYSSSYTTSGESGTSDSSQTSIDKQNLPGTSGTRNPSKINKVPLAAPGSKYPTSSNLNGDPKATQTKIPKKLRSQTLSSQSSDHDVKQNVPDPKIYTRARPKYSDSDSTHDSYSSSTSVTTPVKRCVGRPRTRHLSSSSKAKERESSSPSISPFPKVVRSPQDIRKKTGDKTLQTSSNESASTGDSELMRMYVTRISNQTPPKHLKSRDGAVATTSYATSIDGFYPEDRQAPPPDRCSLKTMTPSPIRQTRSRSKSGDTAADDDGINVPLKQKTSRLMTILTSEHDYSHSGPHELGRDKTLPLAWGENVLGRNTDLQRTIQIQETGTEPGTSNTKISNTDSASLRIITSQETSNITSLSSTSVQDEDKNLGFDLNDFVIRRRRLRSESLQDELWEGLPSVTPFRKHPSKLKDENECRCDTNMGDDLPDENNPSSEPASSSNESLQDRTSSSTIGLISEIDSILTDTSSSCQGHVSFGDVPSLEEATPECSTCDASGVEVGASEEEAGASSLQRVLDYDLQETANNSLYELDTNVKSMFSSDISSCASTFISRDFTSPNEHQYCTEGASSMKPGSRSSGQLTFRSDPGTPMPSGPESVWWSDKANSEGWATPVADPLAISPLAANSDSPELGILNTESEQGLESSRILKDEYDSLSNSCDAVDGSVFKEVMERKGTNGLVEVSAEVINSNMTPLPADIQLATSSDTNTSVSLTEDNDEKKSPVRFMVTRSDCANIDSDTAKETGDQVMQPTSSEPPKPESSSSSGEFLHWSKKKDKRKISFPKIVLRKCKESSLRVKERHSPQPKDDAGETQSMTETANTTSECPASGSTSLTPIKRSARLMKKVDSSASGQCSRSDDFVYTPLKRDDNKTKTRMSTESPSPSRRRRSSSDICQGEEDAGACQSTDRNIPDIDVHVLSPRQLRMLEREGRDVIQTDSNHGLPLKARWKKKVKRNLKNTPGALKKSSGTSFDQRERPELQQTPSCLPPRRKKGPIIDEELLANPVLDKHACVLWSSEHRRHFQMSHPDASSAALDELLRRHWSQELTAQEKMKYFIRARDAVRDEDKHQPRTNRAEAKRGGRSGSSQKSTEEEDEKSGLEQFTRLKTKRQKDLLTKWLHFFQKVLSRQDYAKFIEEVKEGILEAEAQNKPNKTRGLTSKIFSHKKLLFVKMNSLKGHVMAQYHRRKRRLKDLHKLAFYILVTRLIQGKPCSFIKGCRSKRLTGVLQDLKDLEYGDSIAVLGYPIPTNSFTNLYKEIVETVDSCMFREEPLDADHLGNPETVAEDVTSKGRDEAVADTEKTKTNSVQSKTSVEKKNTVSLLQKHPLVQGPEWYDKPVSEQFMTRTVNELRNVTIFPQLHPRTLDSVFLPPPFGMPVCGAPTVGRSLLQRAPSQVQYRCVATPWISGCRPAVTTTPRAHSSHQSVREVLYADARDAFQRSYTSNTDPCCEMDSPSCVLSTWLVADKVSKQTTD